MRQFEQKDFEVLNAWARGHKVPEIAIEELPSLGLIEDDVLAGFLYQTDSGVCFLEHFVSNPDATARQVAQALDVMVLTFKGIAASYGIRKMFAISKRRSVKKRVQKLGFALHEGEWGMLSQEVH